MTTVFQTNYVRRIVCLVLLGWLTGLAVPVPSLAHPIDAWGDFKLFKRLTLDQAKTTAREQAAIVFVYASGPGEEVPAYLESPEPRYWLLSKLIIEETVPLQLEVGNCVGALDPYGVAQYPTLLLLNADGTERRRMIGDATSEQLQQWLEEDLSGADTIDRLRKAIASAETVDPLFRERLGDALLRMGKKQEALAEYVWCVDTGFLLNVRYMARHRSILAARLADMARTFPPAKQTLKRFQKEMAATIIANPSNHLTAMMLAEIDLRLGETAHTLAVFDQLPPKSRARHTLFNTVFAELVNQKRYGEAVFVPAPDKRYRPAINLQIRNAARAFRQEVVAVQMGRLAGLEDPNAPLERGMRSYAILRGVLLVEALLGTNQVEDAIDLARKVVEFDDTQKTRTLLVEHAKRAGYTSLADELPEPEVLETSKPE